jgi:pimeloyl-ACP methyl ester carboxylesterase
MVAGLEHAGFVGTSRGGLILMALSAMKPSLMRAIVLNDIGPEIDGPGLVRIKKSLEGGLSASSWKDAGQLMKSTGKKQFPNWDDSEWERQARFVFKEKDGKLIRNYDPKLLNTLAAIDLDVRLPSLWPQFTGLSKIPMMLIRGERTDLLADSTVSKMQDIHPAMELVRVADQGHAPDLGSAGLPEKIDAFFGKHGH